MPSVPKQHKQSTGVLIPIAFTLLYAFVGAVYVFATDRILPQVFSYPTSFTTLERYTVEAGYLVFTTALIYMILYFTMASQRRAGAQLRETNETLRTLIQSSPLAIISTSPNGTIQSWNPAAERIFGWSEDEILGHPRPYIPDEKLDEFQLLQEQAMMGERPAGIEMRCQTKDGVPIDVSISLAPLHDADGRLNGVMSVIADITERKHTEGALFAEKERLAVTLRSIGDGVITTDQGGHILMMNAVAEQLTGWTQEEAFGKTLTDVYDILDERTRERCENPLEEIIELESPRFGMTTNMILTAKDGTERIISDSVAPIYDSDGDIIGVVLVFADITEKRRLETELQKADKLESVGILAGGIAHDFNNILTAIVGNISLAKTHAKPDTWLYQRLDDSEKASLRARDLTQQLLTFSRGGTLVKRTASITEVITDSVQFALLGSHTRCEVLLPQTLWPVEVDAGQISQVINNLIINADQAMPNGGVITVQGENITVEDDTSLPLKPGVYVMLTVADRGIGIPNEYLPKIFDPYFTTKQRGSGLGLATTYSIMQRHGGCITVESEVGVGTTFRLYLPAVPTARLPKKPSECVPTGCSGKILVMDDEEIVREVVADMLRALGYQAVTATDGQEAITCYLNARAACSPFDAVIMDLTIPGGMGGKEAILRLMEIDAGVKAIASSGYATDPVMSDYRHYGFRGIIAKPYKLHELGETIATLLHGADERGIAP